MTLASTLALCAAVAPPTIALYVVARQRDNARETADLFKDWWLAASDRALRAEARLDLIHHQHVNAGKASHDLTDEERALRDATTERLRNSPPTPLRPRAEIEAEVAALRAARKAATHPLDASGLAALANRTAGERPDASPPSSFPAPDQQRGKRKDRPVIADGAVRTRGADFTSVTGLHARQRNRAAQSIPADTPKVEGGRHG